jgi:hypothetical protein
MKMKDRNDKTTRRELQPRCRHTECVAARAEEFAAMGLVNFSVAVHTSDLPVRGRRGRTG